MFLNVIGMIFFGAVAAFFTNLYYSAFYTHEPLVMLTLLIFSILVYIILYLPYFGKRKSLIPPFLSILTPFIVLSLTYNLVFTLAVIVLSLILGRLFSKDKKYTSILFTDSNEIVEINYVTHIKKRDVLKRSHIFLAPLTLILLFVTFAYNFPFTLWEVKAFPVNLTTKQMISENVLASGDVTASVIYNDRVMLVGDFFDIENSSGVYPSPCKTAGLLTGDVITHINGKDALKSDFILKGSTGDEIEVTVTRFSESEDVETLTFKVTPIYSDADNAYRLGIMYYNTPVAVATTIQTVTFSYPDTGYFAATAHNADFFESNDSSKSVILDSTVTGSDDNGLTAEPESVIGSGYLNTSYGTFGILNEPKGREMTIAKKWQVHPGKATLYSAFEGGEAKEYRVYITGTYRIDQKDIICIAATDERIKAFGGVMRGMSGTPLIQDGRLVGSLCNVDVNGFHAYAIFASDMAHELMLGEDILKENALKEDAQ